MFSYLFHPQDVVHTVLGISLLLIIYLLTEEVSLLRENSIKGNLSYTLRNKYYSARQEGKGCRSQA